MHDPVCPHPETNERQHYCGGAVDMYFYVLLPSHNRFHCTMLGTGFLVKKVPEQSDCILTIEVQAIRSATHPRAAYQSPGRQSRKSPSPQPLPLSRVVLVVPP